MASKHFQSHREAPPLLSIPPEVRLLIYEYVFTIEDYGTSGVDRTRAKDLIWPNQHDTSRRVLIGTHRQLGTFTYRADLCWLGQLDTRLLLTCKQMYAEARDCARHIKGVEYVRIERLHYRWRRHQPANAVIESVGTILWWPTGEAGYQRQLDETKPKYSYITADTIPDDPVISVSAVWQYSLHFSPYLAILSRASDPVSLAMGYSWKARLSWNAACLQLANKYWSLQAETVDQSPGGNLLVSAWRPHACYDTRAQQYTVVNVNGKHTITFNRRTREIVTCEDSLISLTERYRPSNDVQVAEDLVEWLLWATEMGGCPYVGPATRLPVTGRDCLLDVGL